MKRKFSDKLNGFWEEGYHYYLEFDNEKLTVRNYDRSVAIRTTVDYDAKAIDRGERTVISLADNVLSRDGSGEPFTMIRELAYEGGELKFLYYYTIMGEKLYTLKKVDHGPFAHIIIRDDEYLKQLQGSWYQIRGGKLTDEKMVIVGNTIKALWSEAKPFHVVSYTYDKDSVYIVPENLISSDFGGYTAVEVKPGMLTTRMIIYDASMPVFNFVRKGDVGKVNVPDEADRPVGSTMVNTMDKPAGNLFGNSTAPTFNF